MEGDGDVWRKKKYSTEGIYTEKTTEGIIIIF